MSHVASIDIEIHELDDLAAACETLGLELVRGQTTHRWYGKFMDDYSKDDAAYKAIDGFNPRTDYGHCEHAIRIPGNDRAYEIGLVRCRAEGVGEDRRIIKDPEGDFWVPVYDFYSGGHGMTEKVGDQSCGLLKQAYGAIRATRHARSRGYAVRTTRVGSKIVLECTK